MDTFVGHSSLLLLLLLPRLVERRTQKELDTAG